MVPFTLKVILHVAENDSKYRDISPLNTSEKCSGKQAFHRCGLFNSGCARAFFFFNSVHFSLVLCDITKGNHHILRLSENVNSDGISFMFLF